jgi:hypothetical protein
MIYKKFSPYLQENTALHHYKDQLVNAVQRNNRCLQSESYQTNKYTVGEMQSYWLLNWSSIQLPLRFKVLRKTSELRYLSYTRIYSFFLAFCHEVYGSNYKCWYSRIGCFLNFKYLLLWNARSWPFRNRWLCGWQPHLAVERNEAV